MNVAIVTFANRCRLPDVALPPIRGQSWASSNQSNLSGHRRLSVTLRRRCRQEPSGGKIDTVDFVVVPKGNKTETTFQKIIGKIAPSDKKIAQSKKRFFRKRKVIKEFRIDSVDFMVIPKKDDTVTTVEKATLPSIFSGSWPTFKPILRQACPKTKRISHLSI
ncbi:hypothetical protein AVEN_270611-1 [Araneus ventricosus]|uniref:Uncharacterized protein n=1 Tax=Araneus ventricosus TaxID=182803 RepID=A0A4Y2DGQ0_ARAVE|nr:hypothetical protein AVEN_270611-1 [Araneus ventricosus]